MSGLQSTIGDYRIVARIGEGGMGAVFRAQHVTLGHEVAIKLLPNTLATDPTAQQWFRRGAASAAALQHPNILPVYHYGEHDGAPYLVMPYIAGGSLKDRMQRGPLNFAEIVRVLEQLVAALDYAHEQGIVHRDVKPANLLLDERGTLYLADFGIARAMESATRYTRTGSTIGTPEYMAPEQARGQADHRSDLYAVGIILYQLLTGQVPFTGDSAVEILMQHIQDPVPLAPVRQANPALPPSVEPVVMRALAKDPTARYQRGADLVADLTTALSNVPERPNAWQPDNQPTVFASNSGNGGFAPRTPTPSPALPPTPAPNTVPALTPVPHGVPVAAPPVRHYSAAGNRPPIRNPLVVGLSVALAAALLLTSVVGVRAWALNRPDTDSGGKSLTTATPTATMTATPQPTSTATATLPATTIPTATPPATATATQQPTNTPTRVPTSTPTRTPTAPPVVNKNPLSTKPTGWKTYIGTTVPFSIYYPSDWVVDESKISDGKVYFYPAGGSAASNTTWLVIGTGGKQDPNANPDTLRNDYFHSEFDGAYKAGIEDTGSGTWANGVTFATLYVSYLPTSTATKNCYGAVAVGLRNGYSWRYRANSLYSDWNSDLSTYFNPMLKSLNIWGNP